jgi:hypothetical protein
LLVVLGALTAQACAWGTQGHQVVAELAFNTLTPKARFEVTQLLALEPGETLASISMWADERKSPATSAWHYVNFPRDTCQFETERDCPDGQCVVAALERQLAVLASSPTPERRLKALKYVVHLVGDLHQPLHAGYQDDRGGNSYTLQAFMQARNLHALWDGGLVKNLNLDNTALTALVRQSMPQQEQSNLSLSQAAEESCRLVATPGFYPARQVTERYVQQFTPVLLQRLAMAGARLAGLLNRTWP